MPGDAQSESIQPVAVVEADALDRMNETRALIAQRAYEIYASRVGGPGSDQDDWFKAEGELLPKLPVEYDVTDTAVELTAQVPGLDAKDLEVAVGHRRAVVLGIHTDSRHATNGSSENKRVIRVLELPFDVDPALATATLQSGRLQIVLPRSS